MPGIDAYCLTHNETSTGVAMPLGPARRAPRTARSCSSTPPRPRAACASTPAEVDVYYFAPQKCFASDGGLWLAACRRGDRAHRAHRRHPTGGSPAFLDLEIALENSRKDQTYNTPALATIFLAADQVDWINQHGGLSGPRRGATARPSHDLWLGRGLRARHAVRRYPADRSTVVATIDLDDSVDATTVSAVLRANGIVDTDRYRKLGRNQLRIAMFPAIEPDDIATLTRCIDHVIASLLA